MSMTSRFLLSILVMFVVVGAFACSDSSAPPNAPAVAASPVPTSIPSPTPTPITPEALLERSGKVMESLTSFHFRLRHKSGNTPLLRNLAIDEAEGDVIKPDQLSTDFNGVFGGFAIKSSLVTLGDDSYMTNPLTGQWEGVPTEISPLGFFNPSEGIAAMLKQVEPTGLRPDRDGVHRVNGRLPAEALSPLLGGTVKGAIVDVELEIDKVEYYLVKVTIAGRVTELEPDGTVRVIELSRFNEPLVIEAPQ